MQLIPCTTGTVAVYSHEGGRFTQLPVEAWAEDGTPYVASERGLVSAARVAGLGRFAYLEAGHRHVVPGAGWEIVETVKDGDKTLEEVRPVVAFLITADGFGTPVAADGSGALEPMSNRSDVALRPVGGWAEEREVPAGE